MSTVSKHATPFAVLTPEKALDFAVRCEERANHLQQFTHRQADIEDFRAMAAIWRQFTAPAHSPPVQASLL